MYLYCKSSIIIIIIIIVVVVVVVVVVARHAVAQLVEALRYKPEGCGFDSRCVIHLSLPAAPWPWEQTQPLTEMSTMNISWG